MRMFLRLLFVGLSLLLAAGVRAQQPTGKPAGPAPAGTRVVAQQPGFVPVATVQEIMATMIDPASKVVFKAVSSTTTPDGKEEQTAPKNNAEWAAVRKSALMMVEGANLIMMGGRHITHVANAPAVEGELPPAEIEIRVSKDRANWDRLAREFGQAAAVVLKAATAKDAKAVFASAGGVDTACENCHLRFWYPDQEKLFQKK